MKIYNLFFLLLISYLGYASPINDDPCDAINIGMLTVGTPKTQSGTNVGATTTQVFSSLQGAVNLKYHTADVWFKFQLPAGYYSTKIILTPAPGSNVKFTINTMSKHTCSDYTGMMADPVLQQTGNYFNSTDAIASNPGEVLTSTRTFSNCKYVYGTGSYQPGDDIYIVVGGASSSEQGAFTLSLEPYGLNGGGCPTTSCSASIGNVAVTGGTLKATNEYDLSLGSTLTFTSTGIVMPTSTHINSYAIFDCDPGVLTAAQLLDLNNHPCYVGSSNKTSETTTNENGMAKGLPGNLNKVWVVPYTRFPDNTGGTKAIVNDGTGCYKIGTPIIVNYLSTSTPPVPCGTCTTPDCPIGNIPRYLDRFPSSSSSCTPIVNRTNCPGQGAQVCQTGIKMVGTETTYHTVTTDAFGNVGAFVQSVGITTGGTYSITSELYEMNDCNGTPKVKGKFSLDDLATGLNPSNVHTRSAASGSWNPEWKGLDPNKSYILKTVFNIGSGHTINEYCMDYYGSTSCIANNGNQTVKINNATPPLTKVYATNSFGLCFNDEFSITTSNAKPSVDYAIYVGAPTSNNPASEPTIYSADYKLNLDQLTEKSTGNTSPVIVHLNTTTFKPTNNTIWWVPISTSIVGNYDATCYQMDYQNESYKVTYLNDIKITATEVCASSKVTLKFEGGAPEFISGKKYNITTSKGTLSNSSVSTSGGTIDLTGLSTNDSYTISVTDEIGCVKSYTGTYTCSSCTPPSLTGLTSICEGSTVEWTSTGTLTSSDNSFITIASSGANKYNLTTLKPTISTTNLKVTATLAGCSVVKDITIYPKATITGASSVCAGSTITLIGSGTASTTSPWISATTTNATVSNAGVVSGVITGNGNSDITYTDVNGCSVKKIITVNPVLKPSVTCGTSTATSTEFTWSPVTGATGYNLVYNNDGAGNQNVNSHTTTSYTLSPMTAGKSATIIVTPTGTGCFSASTITTCSANNCPTPTINTHPVNSLECPGKSTSFSIDATSNPGVALVYKWEVSTNNGTTFSTVTDGGVYSDATTKTLKISSNTGLENYQYRCVVTEQSSGVGCSKTSTIGKVTYKPVPVINAITDVPVCNGSTTTAINFASTPTGSTFTWTNNNTNIGLAATGTGNIASFTATNSTNAQLNALVTVSAILDGCQSANITFNINVNPSLQPTVVCGTPSTTSVTFDWRPGVSGATNYSLEYKVNSGSAITASINTSTYTLSSLNQNDVVDIKITPTGTGCFTQGTGSCTAINCTPPTFTAFPSDLSVCEGSPASLSGSSSDAQSLIWQIKNTTLNSWVDIPGQTASLISIPSADILINGSQYRLKANESTGNCPSYTNVATLTVKPIPVMTAITDKQFCPVTKVNDPLKSTKDIEFKVSQIGSPTFTWTSDNQSVGVTSGGTNINDFSTFITSTPINTSPLVSKITVKPTLNQCVGLPISFNITVKPTVKPIFSTPVIDFTSVKFEWTSSSITPDFWEIDTAIADINVSAPPLNMYKSVNPVAGTINNYTINGLNSSKKAYINVKAKQDPTNTDLFCAVSDGYSAIPTPCIKPNKPLQPLVNPVCEGSPISVTGVLADATANFQWKISTDGGTVWNDVSTSDFGSTGTTNELSTSTTKTYMNNALVKLVLTDIITGSCSEESESVTLVINPLPSVKLVQPAKSSLCVNEAEVSATVQSIIGSSPMKVDYTFNGTTSKDQDISSLEIKFPTSIDMNYSLSIDKVIDANGCESLLTGLVSTVVVNKNPTPEFTMSETIGCIPLLVNFIDISGQTYKDVTWDFGTGTNSSKDAGNTSFTYQKEGDYTVTYTVEDMNGCKSDNVKVEVIHAKSLPKAVISSDRNLINIYENVVSFDSKLSQNASFYKWDFGDNSSISNDPFVKHKYDPNTPGKFKVNLIVSNSPTNMVCSDTAITWIDFPEEVVYYIPNSFTPNGDEFNNTFQPIFTSGYDPQNYSFIIFDRWGQVVFESNNPTVGWDGTFGDNVLDNGTFVWKLGFKEKANDNEHYTSGHVNLVK